MAGAIEAELRALGTPARAEGERRYLKSDLEFVGAAVGQIRRTVAAFVARTPELRRRDAMELARALWSAPIHERRMAATLVLEAAADRLVPADLPTIERFILDSRTWALVDGLAVDVAGTLLVHHPEAAGRLDRWASHPDFWLRRAALLAQIRPLQHGADFGGFARHAEAMLDEREFFIRKAIGWVLREVSKTRPDEVWAWIAPRAGMASGVTVREAAKYLGAERGGALLAANRERRPAVP